MSAGEADALIHKVRVCSALIFLLLLYIFFLLRLHFFAPPTYIFASPTYSCAPSTYFLLPSPVSGQIVYFTRWELRINHRPFLVLRLNHHHRSQNSLMNILTNYCQMWRRTRMETRRSIWASLVNSGLPSGTSRQRKELSEIRWCQNDWIFLGFFFS